MDRLLRTVLPVAATLIVLASPGDGSEAEQLHFFAIDGAGNTIASQKADEQVNPASVVKVGTSLWALSELGSDHRYETTFGILGLLDRTTGELDGDLVVDGGGDPDFQWENAILVARELNRLGLHRVKGNLRVRGVFWFGWEHGVEKRLLEPRQRGERMGRRLMAAFDPKRWDRSAEASWKAMCERRGWDETSPPRIEVTGSVRVSEVGDAGPLVVHRSNPLTDTLRRFNVYSNNDIVRIADGLGSTDDLEWFLLERLGLEAGGIELETASGERQNRMPVRLMVELVEELRTETAAQELELRHLLPVIGCDPGHTRRMYPALAALPLTGTVTCKTGTLTHTDGGVSVLAGVFTSPVNGEVVFAVAVPSAGGRLQHWRQVQQRWLMSLMDEQGGAVPAPCGKPLPFSDTFAEVETMLSGG
jgi:D-alanyl-D-alanine carboxypeptidase/D-alanyl-D-alanine-endopeptidase (penicillin-binding protein 4)